MQVILWSRGKSERKIFFSLPGTLGLYSNRCAESPFVAQHFRCILDFSLVVEKMELGTLHDAR
jgi:hypothetical protein